MATAYKIKYGDTLESIAKANGTTVDVLAKANGIADPSKIYAGRTLNISTPAPVAPVVPAPVVQPEVKPDPIVPPPTTPTPADARKNLIAEAVAGGIKDPSLIANKINSDLQKSNSGMPDLTMAEIQAYLAGNTGKSIGDVASSIVPDYVPDSVLEAAKKKYGDIANGTVDEETIRKNVRDRMQAEVDAINQVYAQKYSEATSAGTGRRGTGRAISARSGLLGSDMGAAIDDNIVTDNNKILASIDAEKAAKISEIITASETNASNEIINKQNAIKSGAEQYLKYLGESETRKTTAINNLAKMLVAKGIDPSTMTDAERSKLISGYGTDIATITSAFVAEKTAKDKADLEAQKTKAGISQDEAAVKKSEADAKKAETDINAFSLADGTQRYIYDPKTGTSKLVASNDKDYKATGGTGTGTGGGGSTGVYKNDMEALISSVGAGITAKNQRDAFYSALKGARNEADKLNVIAKAVNITGAPKADLVNTASGLKQLDAAISLVKNGTKTGLVQAGKDYAFNLVGSQVSPELTQLKQLITASLQPYRSSVTGAAWGQQEEAEYKAMFGSVKDNHATLLTKLESLRSIMNNKRVSIVQSYADPLGNSTAFDGEYSPLPNSPTGTTAPTTPAETVKVKNPQTGQVGTIPRANLEKALAKGYTQVQ